MIRDRENGLLCDVGDADALAKGVLEVLNRPDVGRQLADAARHWAEQFSWHNVFPKLMEAYGLDPEPSISDLEPAVLDPPIAERLKFRIRASL